MSKIKFNKIDFARIAKEAFIVVKNVVVSDVEASIVDLDLVNTKAKVVIVLISSLKTLFIYNFVEMLKLTIR